MKHFLSETLGNTKTSKKRKKNCCRGHCKLQRKSQINFIITVLKDSTKFPNLLNKSTPPWTVASEIIWESRRDGFLLCRYSLSKMLEQLFRKVWWCTFWILANKELRDGQFLGNFLKYFKTGLLKNTSGRLFLQDFSLNGSVKEAALKNLRKSQENVRRSI